MLVLFESPAGYALFKVLDDGSLKDPDNLYKHFESGEKANKLLKLKAFSKFDDTAEALVAATAVVDGKLGKGLKKFLKKSIVSKELKDKLAVADAKLGNLISSKLEVKCVNDTAVNELIRGIRSQMSSLITGIPEKDMSAMALGLSHSLSRFKLKFSPDKVDTMIVQAISLLDDIDKELNTYAMRVREWYGWHFPELSKLIGDNIVFARLVKRMGYRTNATAEVLSDVLEEEVADEVREAAQISMGTEVSEEDMNNIHYLCDQVIAMAEYRTQLFSYLKNRMAAIAPNLTVMVGELVGARLIAHAGSLLNLAKQPSSTVQILGAEKALFRALKSKHDTPKYGLIYHASLVGQSAPKDKGKISRILAAKIALSVRVDALGEGTNNDLGRASLEKVESRLREFEGRRNGGSTHRISGQAKAKAKAAKYENTSEVMSYNAAADVTPTTPKSEKKKKRKREDDDEEDDAAMEVDNATAGSKSAEKKKKKKRKLEDTDGEETPKKKKAKTEDPGSEKKKKKKKKKEKSHDSDEDSD